MEIMHEPAMSGNVIGLGGYDIDQMQIVSYEKISQLDLSPAAQYLVCDKNSEYKPGDYIVIKNKNGELQLSKTLLDCSVYIGKVIMTIQSY